MILCVSVCSPEQSATVLASAIQLVSNYLYSRCGRCMGLFKVHISFQMSFCHIMASCSSIAHTPIFVFSSVTDFGRTVFLFILHQVLQVQSIYYIRESWMRLRRLVHKLWTYSAYNWNTTGCVKCRLCSVLLNYTVLFFCLFGFINIWFAGSLKASSLVSSYSVSVLIYTRIHTEWLCNTLKYFSLCVCGPHTSPTKWWWQCLGLLVTCVVTLCSLQCCLGVCIGKNLMRR